MLELRWANFRSNEAYITVITGLDRHRVIQTLLSLRASVKLNFVVCIVSIMTHHMHVKLCSQDGRHLN